MSPATPMNPSHSPAMSWESRTPDSYLQHEAVGPSIRIGLRVQTVADIINRTYDLGISF